MRRVRLSQRPAGTAGAHGEDLGEDRDGGLLRRGRAEVEPGRPARSRSSSSSATPSSSSSRAAAPGSSASRASRCRTPRSRAHPAASGRSNLSSCVRTTTAVPRRARRARAPRPATARSSSSALGSRSRRGKAWPRVRRRSSASRAASPPRTERLGGVDGAVDEEARRRNEDVGEDRPAFLLEHVSCGHGARAACSRAGVVELRPDVRAGDDGQRHVRLLLVARAASTNTSISPPHGSPTPNAISSVMPYVTRRGSPPASTSCAARMTSLSTQPSRPSPRGCRPRGRRASTRPGAGPSCGSRPPWRPRRVLPHPCGSI